MFALQSKGVLVTEHLDNIRPAMRLMPSSGDQQNLKNMPIF